MSSLKVYTDGGSRGNPGPAAAGIHICDEFSVIHQFSKYLGYTTNNQAEYQASLLAMQYLVKHPFVFQKYSQIECILDSELIVKQINGQYRVKHPDLVPVYQELKSLISQIPIPVTFSHVKRHLNHHADQLVNKELDSQK